MNRPKYGNQNIMNKNQHITNDHEHRQKHHRRGVVSPVDDTIATADSYAETYEPEKYSNESRGFSNDDTYRSSTQKRVVHFEQLYGTSDQDVDDMHIDSDLSSNFKKSNAQMSSSSCLHSISENEHKNSTMVHQNMNRILSSDRSAYLRMQNGSNWQYPTLHGTPNLRERSDPTVSPIFSAANQRRFNRRVSISGRSLISNPDTASFRIPLPASNQMRNGRLSSQALREGFFEPILPDSFYLDNDFALSMNRKDLLFGTSGGARGSVNLDDQQRIVKSGLVSGHVFNKRMHENIFNDNRSHSRLRFSQQGSPQFHSDTQVDDPLLGSLRSNNYNINRSIGRSRNMNGRDINLAIASHPSNQRDPMYQKIADDVRSDKDTGISLPKKMVPRTALRIGSGMHHIGYAGTGPRSSLSNLPCMQKLNQMKQRNDGESSTKKIVLKKKQALKIRGDNRKGKELAVRRRPTFRELRRVSMIETQEHIRKMRDKLNEEQIRRLDALMQVDADDVVEAVKFINVPPFLWSDKRLPSINSISLNGVSPSLSSSSAPPSSSSSISSTSGDMKTSGDCKQKDIPQNITKSDAPQSTPAVIKVDAITSLSKSELSSSNNDVEISRISLTDVSKSPLIKREGHSSNADTTDEIKLGPQSTVSDGGRAVVTPVPAKSQHTAFDDVESVEESRIVPIYTSVVESIESRIAACVSDLNSWV